MTGRPNEAGEGTWQHRYDSALLVPTASPYRPPFPPNPPRLLPPFLVPYPRRPTGTTQLTPFSSVRQGKSPHRLRSHHSSSPCIPDSIFLPSPPPPTLSHPRSPLPAPITTTTTTVPTVPTLAGHRRLVCSCPLLQIPVPSSPLPLPLFDGRYRGNFYGGTAWRESRAFCRFAEERDEHAKAATQKILREKKTSTSFFFSIFLSLPVFPILVPHRQNYVPFSRSSSTSARFLLRFLFYLFSDFF